MDQRGVPELTGGREVLGRLNEGKPKRSASLGKQVGEGLKRRIGSLRRKPVAGQ